MTNPYFVVEIENNPATTEFDSYFFGAEFADEFVRHYTHWMYAPQPPEVQE